MECACYWDICDWFWLFENLDFEKNQFENAIYRKKGKFLMISGIVLIMYFSDECKKHVYRLNLAKLYLEVKIQYIRDAFLQKSQNW